MHHLHRNHFDVIVIGGGRAGVFCDSRWLSQPASALRLERKAGLRGEAWTPNPQPRVAALGALA